MWRGYVLKASGRLITERRLFPPPLAMLLFVAFAFVFLSVPVSCRASVSDYTHRGERANEGEAVISAATIDYFSHRLIGCLIDSINRIVLFFSFFLI